MASQRQIGSRFDQNQLFLQQLCKKSTIYGQRLDKVSWFTSVFLRVTSCIKVFNTTQLNTNKFASQSHNLVAI
jgi:hypothetical protein